jgi:SulP family sulfate permease
MNIFHGFSLNNLRGDFFGGLTAAVVALPLALAFGVSSGLGPLAGLYGAIIVGFFASLFGGTKTQITGPTGPMTVVVASIFLHFDKNAQIVFFVISLSGLIQIFIGISKLGEHVQKIPSSVITGFMTGIGIIIISLQIPVFLGLDSQASASSAILSLQNISHYKIDSLTIGLIGLLIVIFFPKKIDAYFPRPIIALVIGSLLASFYFTNQKLIGTIPSGIPEFSIYVPTIKEIPEIIYFSLMLSSLGVIDSLLTSVVADNMTKTKHLSNKESIGQGIGNIISGFFGGLAGAGATMRTVVNIQSGGKTPYSGLLHSITLILIIIFLGHYASMIPLAILASILLKVGYDIIDWDFFKNFRHKSRVDLFVVLLVILLIVFINLLLAIFVGTILSYLLNKHARDINIKN